VVGWEHDAHSHYRATKTSPWVCVAHEHHKEVPVNKTGEKIPVEIDPSQMEYQLTQLETIIHYLEARDEASSLSNLHEVQLSPLTLRAREMYTYLSEIWQEGVAELARA
jgi:hypothetical protein